MENPVADLRDAPPAEFEHQTFSADAALIAELGERLVGQAHIALAELIKNSYDADATICRVTVGPDFLAVEDDGHGMTIQDYKKRWMRVGTQTKRREKTSPAGRRLTGSKGVGRLAAQFLGERLYLQTKHIGSTTVECRINWREVTHADDLVKAEAEYRTSRRNIRFCDAKHGTRIVISGLKHDWTESRIEELAREIWFLRPPFNPSKVKGGYFNVLLRSEIEGLQSKFEKQMKAALSNYEARIIGRVRGGRKHPVLKLGVEFAEGEFREFSSQAQIQWDPPGFIDDIAYEIRVFSHSGKQRHGVLLGDVREYFRRYGGVHLTDAGFRLPYYGVQHDWLDLELTHSHRLSVAGLLPESLRVDKALLEMPTQTRLYGVVMVDTSREREVAKSHNAREHLEIQVTRDRLVANDAHKQLKEMVRAGLEFYSAQKRAGKLHKLREEIESTPAPEPDRFIKRLDVMRSEMSETAYSSLREEASSLRDFVDLKEKSVVVEKAVMASLATAGMAAVALEHELKRSLGWLTRRLAQMEENVDDGIDARDLLREIRAWLDRAKESRVLLTGMLDPENREEREHYRVKATVDQVASASKPLMRGIKLDTENVKNRRLPLASFAEWQAVFQNVITNAINAMLDSRQQSFRAWSEDIDKTRHRLVFEDTGVGIDPKHSDRLFEPFHRELKISKQRKELGVGGSGLGLTIVRTITSGVGMDVRFISPSDGFRTALEFEWELPDVK